jgi:flavodoxin
VKPRILVVHFSRTGRTRVVAEAVARALAADSEQVRDRVDREGVLGFVRSAVEALSGVSCEIRVPVLDPSTYDLVVVGTPIWAASASTPVRTYLWLERDRLRRVAFFVTHGGSGSARALRQLRELAGQPPAATLVLRDADVASGAYRKAVERFARSIAASAGRQRAKKTTPKRRGASFAPAFARRAEPRAATSRRS